LEELIDQSEIYEIRLELREIVGQDGENLVEVLVALLLKQTGQVGGGGVEGTVVVGEVVEVARGGVLARPSAAENGVLEGPLEVCVAADVVEKLRVGCAQQDLDVFLEP